MIKRFLGVNIFVTSCLLSSLSFAEMGSLTVTSSSIEDGRVMLEKYAFCAPDGRGKTKKSGNISPQLSWSQGPKGTKSYAIVVVDPDVPARFDDANVEGRIIPENFERQDFYHWVLVDLPKDVNSIEEGQGKDISLGVPTINDYSSFIKELPAQSFLGYDGPCPPFNDARVHQYNFKVYALDVASIGAKQMDSGRDIIENIEKHALATGEIIGRFSNYNRR